MNSHGKVTVEDHEHTQDVMALLSGGYEASCTCGWVAVRHGDVEFDRNLRSRQARTRAEQAAKQHAEKHS